MFFNEFPAQMHLTVNFVKVSLSSNYIWLPNNQ